MHLLINVNIFQQRKIFLFPKKDEEKKSNKRQPKVLFNIFTTRNEKGVQSCRKAKKYYERFSKNEVIRFFFLSGFLFHEHSRITGLQGKGEGIPLAPHYHFHPLHGHLDISRGITAESSPLRIASSRTRTGNVWFPSASR